MQHLDRGMEPTDREDTRHIDQLSMVDWVAANYKPSETYSEQILHDWALENGYIKIDKL